MKKKPTPKKTWNKKVIPKKIVATKKGVIKEINSTTYIERCKIFCTQKILWVYRYFFSRRFIIFLWVFAFAIILIYIVLFFFAARIQTFMTFPGGSINLKEITNHPAGIIAAERVEYLSTTGNKITGLYIDNDSPKIVYYFHWNGWPIEYFYSDIQYISDLGYSVIALEFPGYGNSTWIPSIEENRDVSRIFYEKMQQKLGFKDTNVILWWYSVGTALAVDFGRQRDFDALVLFAPFSSRYDMAKETFGFPIQKLFFLEDSYISRESIKLIDEPTLIIHGNKDKVVPFKQWKKVYENSPADIKKFIEIDWFGHSLIPERYGEVLSPYIQDFLSENLTIPKTEVFLDTDLAVKLLEKYQKQSRIENLDFIADNSITKYVDPRVWFTKISYEPQDLIRLERDFIIDSKWDAQMRRQAADAVEKMAEAFYSEFNEKMVVVSSYRSYIYQAGIKARWCPDNLCAKAGHSEHQSGLAVDFWSASSKQYWDSSLRLTQFYTWLDTNAHIYGFHNGYRNGVEIDGYDIEPWHWRYVWREFAEYLHAQELTFAQYYYK